MFHLLVKQVLNAGKNKLRSMDEIKSLVSLCALILNGELCEPLCNQLHCHSSFSSLYLNAVGLVAIRFY